MDWYQAWFNDDYLALYPHRNEEDAARLVVMTRSAGFSVDEMAKAERVDPHTLRQRRLRAERRIRQGLGLAL